MGVIRELVFTRVRNQRDQPLDEHQRIQHEAFGSVSPRFAQVPDHLAVFAQYQAALRERWTGHVATDVLQRFPLSRADARRRVQRIAVRLGP